MLGKLYQKFVLCYTLGTNGILHDQFRLIWTTPWPDEKDLFLKFVIREIRKFPYEVLTFFLDKLQQKILFALQSRYKCNTPYRVWLDLNNSLTRWKRPIFKIPYSRKTQISLWKTNFFVGKLYQKFFLSQSLPTLGKLHTKFGSIWTTLWPNQRGLFFKMI